jgi:hypothetical protein
MFTSTAAPYRNAHNTKPPSAIYPLIPLVESPLLAAANSRFFVMFRVCGLMLMMMNLLLVNDELREKNKFGEMSHQTDEEEHSIELHLPYIRHMFKK